MRDMHRAIAIVLGCGLFAGVALARTDAPVAHSQFHVQLGSTLTQPASGRLLLFATDAKAAIAAAKDGKVDEVDANPFGATQASVAAREVSRLAPGQGVDIDADALAYPAGWSQLPPGDYFVQAVLDSNHDYNYGGRGAGEPGPRAARARAMGSAHALFQRGHPQAPRRGAPRRAAARLRQPGAQRVLGTPHPHARLGAVAAGL